MPTQLPTATINALRRSMAKYSGSVAADTLQQAVAKLLDGVTSILNPEQKVREGTDQTVTTGDTAASVRARVARVLEDFSDPGALAEELNLDFKIKVAREVAQGAGRYVTDQTDVEEYPAWEFSRTYDRDVPRGFKLEKGQLVEDEEDSWPARWKAAAEESGDEDASRILEETDRMIALKASPIWDSLGNGAGGYTDTLGNPFPPFAFNSGYDVDGVPFKECVELGLVNEGDEVPAADIDFGKLFTEVAA